MRLFHPLFCRTDFALRHGIRAKSKESCKGINAMLAFNQLAFTAQPVPVLSRVDLAAMFLQREAFRATNLLFGALKHVVVEYFCSRLYCCACVLWYPQ